jgi:hypothetical protein
MNAITLETIAGRINLVRNDGGVTLNCGPICLILKTSEPPTLDRLLPIAVERLQHADLRPLYMESGVPGSPLLRIYAAIHEDVIYVSGGPFVLRLGVLDCDDLAAAIVSLTGDAS